MKRNRVQRFIDVNKTHRIVKAGWSMFDTKMSLQFDRDKPRTMTLRRADVQELNDRGIEFRWVGEDNA